MSQHTDFSVGRPFPKPVEYVALLESEKWAEVAMEAMMNDPSVGEFIKANEPLQGLMKGFFLMGVEITRTECQNATVDTVNAYNKIPGESKATTTKQEVEAVALMIVDRILKVGTKTVQMPKKEKSNLIFKG